MKVITIILSLLLICNNAYSQSENIERITKYGDADIILPKYDSIIEAYTIPQVKLHADTYEDPRNEVIAFYVNEKDYDTIENIDNIGIDDYFKFYGNKEIAPQKMTSKEFEGMKDMLSQQFSGSNWDVVKESLEDRIKDIKIGAPNLIKEYDINENVRTYICIIRYGIDEEYIDVVMALSAVYIKEKMIFVAYYHHLIGEETLILAEKKSNMIVNKLLSENSK